jgi:signal transduction histidine kinase
MNTNPSPHEPDRDAVNRMLVVVLRRILHCAGNLLTRLDANAFLASQSELPAKERRLFLQKVLKNVKVIHGLFRLLHRLCDPKVSKLRLRVDLGNELEAFCSQVAELILPHSMIFVRTSPTAMSWVDPTLVAIAVLDLLENSIEASPQAGPLVVATGCANFSSEDIQHLKLAGPLENIRPNVSYSYVSVTDTGTGIPEEIARAAVDGDVEKLKSGDHGNGLIEARALAVRHGGWIQIVTYENNGTSIRLYFPFAQEGESDVDYSLAA